MTKRKSDFTLPTNSLEELFSSQEERDDAKLERVKEIPLTELHPFKDHPFKIVWSCSTPSCESFFRRIACA